MARTTQDILFAIEHHLPRIIRAFESAELPFNPAQLYWPCRKNYHNRSDFSYMTHKLSPEHTRKLDTHLRDQQTTS